MHRLPAAAAAALTDIRTGGCSAWQLPPDATCAQVARSLVRDTLTGLALPDDLVYTAITLVSELATNAFQHAPPHRQAPAGLPELWLYHRWHPAPQLVITVFDTHRHWNRRPGPQAVMSDSGRGLEIVAALSAAWGVRPSRPRHQGPYEIRGKAVWAAIRLPDSRPGIQARTAGIPRRPTPHEAITGLHELLTARGITRLQRADSDLACVLSIRPELTVWADACFRWRDGGPAHSPATGGADGYLRRPLDDVVDVAEQLIHRYEEMDVAFPRPAPPAPTTSQRVTP